MSTFAEWFGGHRLRLLRLATVLADDRQTAQDVVQEVAVRAHGRWDQLQAMDQPEAYLRRMVVNEHLSWRRKWARVVPVGSLTDLQLAPSRDHSDQVADRHQLRQELAGLPLRQRTVLVLRYYEGLDDRAIADLLGTRPVTVRAYASRALARLRVEMADERPCPTPAPVWSTSHTEDQREN